MVAASAGRGWRALLRGGAASALLLIALGGPSARAGVLAFAPSSWGSPRGGGAAAACGHAARSPAAGSRPLGGPPLAAPAACLAGAAAALALARRRPRPGRGGTGAGRAHAVVRGASDEEKLLKLVGEFPSDYDQDDMYEVTQACKKMSGAPADAFEQFVGAWKAEWNSRAGSVWGRPSLASLKMKSFSTLPPVKVQVLGTYFRVLDGDVYERVDAFTLPEAGGAQAAMVLAGSWSTGTSEGDWGRGAPRTRCGTHFKTVRLALPAQDPEASKAMLEEAGLGGFLEAGAVDTAGTYVDLDYISGSACVTKDESGTVNVLTRLSEPVPFALD